MKKITLLLLVLITGLKATAGEPIRPYKTNEAVYNLDEAKAFANEKTELAQNWAKEMLNIVNQKVNQKFANVDQILSNDVRYEYVELTSFQNSGKSGNTIYFTQNQNWSGICAVLYYEGQRIILFKAQCLNELRNCVEKNVVTYVAPHVKAKPETVTNNAPKWKNVDLSVAPRGKEYANNNAPDWNNVYLGVAPRGVEYRNNNAPGWNNANLQVAQGKPQNTTTVNHPTIEQCPSCYTGGVWSHNFNDGTNEPPVISNGGGNGGVLTGGDFNWGNCIGCPP